MATFQTSQPPAPSEDRSTVEDYLNSEQTVSPNVAPPTYLRPGAQGQSGSDGELATADDFTPAILTLLEQYGIPYETMTVSEALAALTAAKSQDTTTAADAGADYFQNQYNQVYFDLWGVEPPQGYVEKAMKDMNVYEFEDFERAKPSFRKTETYRNETGSFAESLSGLLGYR